MDNSNLFSQSYDQNHRNRFSGTGNNTSSIARHPSHSNWPVRSFRSILAPQAIAHFGGFGPRLSTVRCYICGVGHHFIGQLPFKSWPQLGFNNSPEIEQQIKDLSDNGDSGYQNEVTKDFDKRKQQAVS